MDTAEATGSSARRCACGALLGASSLYCAACGARAGLICGACLGTVPGDARFCPSCGSPHELAVEPSCPRCRTPILPSGHYCTGCGAALYRFCSGCGGRRLDNWAHCPFCGKKAGVPGRLAQQAAAAGAASAVAALINQGDEEEIEEPAAADVSSAEEHNARGAAAYEAEDFAAAAAHFEKAASLDPREPLYLVNWANALAETGQDTAAELTYKNALDIAPNDPNALLSLGYFYSEREREKEAIQTWRELINSAPDSEEAREARETLRQMGVD